MQKFRVRKTEPKWQEEGKPVEVNQRALIEKILTRYPSKFSLFRELLQNSDDAHSSTVQIHFVTSTAKEADISSSFRSNVVEWVFKNDGDSFTQSDWDRLAKIAEGNPNPASVGAFGVGFYSVLSVTDCPRISSRGDVMEFYWKANKDQLYIRRGTLSATEWTEFKLPLKQPAPMPPTVDLMRFLATSIIFMTYLRDVSIWLNYDCIGHVKKEFATSQAVEFPISTERSEMMVVNKVERHQFVIQVEIINAVCTNDDPGSSQPEDPHHRHAGELGLTVFTSEVVVKATEELTREVDRCTAKKPPTDLKCSLLYTGKDDYDRNSEAHKSHLVVSTVLQELRADLDRALNSKIFIGHSTRQTTGIGGHMASRFIPTMEREIIDLSNAPIWNRELLKVGGLLSRAVYDSELSAIEAPLRKDDIRQRFIHLLKFFSFHESAPSIEVSKLLRDSFFTCSPSPLKLLTPLGVHCVTDIRNFDPVCVKFLKGVPLLSSDVAQAGKRIIETLPVEHRIRDITHEDVIQSLNRNILDEEELVACFRWHIDHPSLVSSAVKWLQVARFRNARGTIIQLSSILYFINRDSPESNIPSPEPLPPSLIPFGVSKHFRSSELADFGWKEFKIDDWIQYIFKPEITTNSRYDVARSSDWAETVLTTISYTPSEKIHQLDKSFANKTCIPTIAGLRRPEDSYLSSPDEVVRIDSSLPVVKFPSGRGMTTEMESLLIAVGVRRHLPIQLVVKQMIETGKWSTTDLIDYIVRAANTFGPTEYSELKSTCLFTEEGAWESTKKPRLRADQLYPPIDNFRRLRLPVIEYRKNPEWRDDSHEAKLLYELGLLRCPPLRVVIELCSSPDDTVNATAFEYLCTNFRSLYPDYNSDQFREVAFIPAAKKNDDYCLEKLENVFLGAEWKTLGFSVIRHKGWQEIIKELGVQQCPSPALILHQLETVSQSDITDAREWFRILEEHGPSFLPDDLDRLSRIRIVPKMIDGAQTWLTPAECYVGENTRRDFYSKLFHFVDFGREANRFLIKCGANRELAEKDIAESLISNPNRFCELAGGPERFLQELCDLAGRRIRIPNETILKMKSSPVLLGMRREKTECSNDWKDTPLLRNPNEIIIIDDIPAYQLFGESIISAPHDMPPGLEDFYVLLGCRYLSTAISEQWSESGPLAATQECDELRDLILRRLPLLRPHYSRHRSETPISWPSSREDIVVKLWKRLSVTRMLHLADPVPTKPQEMWATATKLEQGRIEVWLSQSAKEDMYEIATYLCRALFGTAKLADVLLFKTILSEDEDVLKRRGYPVDRVPEHQPHVDSPSLKRAMSSGPSVALPAIPAAQDNDAAPIQSDGSPARPSGGKEARPGTPTLFQRFTGIVHRACSASPGINPSARQVMSQTDIEDNVNRAIKISNSRGRMPGEYYEHADTRKFFGKVHDGVSINIHNKQDANGFMQQMNEPITHFIRIIKRLAKVYNLSTESFCIFYNDTAGCIAFNRNGVLYVNLRYFMAWHYGDVMQGKPQRALSSWFLTLAHELAHNIDPYHNADHEFWTSEISGAYMNNLFNEFSQLTV